MRKDYVDRDEFIRDNKNTLTLMDDRFMALCLNENIPCVQAIINHIIDKDLTVTETHTHKEFKGQHRSITIDIYAQDSEGKIYDIEIQNLSTGASPKRARFHAAMMDSHHLDENHKFDDLPETYIIFITLEDVLKHNKVMYEIDRFIRGINEPFDDGLHIIYVNCEAKDDGSEAWKVIHDLTCPEPKEMLISELSKRMKFFKSTKKGMKEMNDWFAPYEKIVEERAEKRGEKRGEERGKLLGEQHAKENFAVRLLKLGKMTIEEIAEATELAIAEVTRIAQTIKA